MSDKQKPMIEQATMLSLFSDEPDRELEGFSALDQTLAKFVVSRVRLPAHEQAVLMRAMQQVSQDLALGHSCTEIVDAEQDRLLCQLVANGQWVSKAERTPLNYTHGRLYFHRYWRYETRLATQLIQRIQKTPTLEVDEARLESYFPAEKSPTEVDYQRQAVASSLRQYFSVISGGPGTGKTTTVVKALALMLEANPHLAIALAAPTGKAAMRLQTSIGAGVQQLDCDRAVKTKMPSEVKTLHRLLGSVYRSPKFKHNAQNSLPYDVVVVDEASMVDLALMSKLVDALKPDAKLLLLGDKDQLSSVESGSVLSDLTQALPANTHELQHSYRFKGEIKAFASLINAQNDQAWSFLKQNACEKGMIDFKPAKVSALVAYAKQQMALYFQQLASFTGDEAAFKALFAAFQAFQILCSNRKRALGVQAMNQAMVQACHPQAGQKSWFHGRPVMIQENQPSIGLYNGDIGLCLVNPETGEYWIWFEQPDGSIKHFLPSRLPQCETAYAMTIHKSQGSEFNEVLIVLDTQHNPIMTKELVYTAITRAKQRAVLAVDATIFKQALHSKVQRHSGLQIWLDRDLTI